MEEEPEAKRPKPESKLEAALSGASGFPRKMPQLPELSVPAQLALACRILAASGFALDVAGHITAKRPGDDGSMWCTPYGVFWRDISAGDILVIDRDGAVLTGPWDVTPATAIHTELHRARADIEVVVHNHPYYGSLLSALHLVPDIADQQAIMFDGDIALFNEYGGAVDTAEEGQKLAQAVGSATAVILANHGVLITGESVAQATYRAVTFERTCRLHYDAMAAGRSLVPVPQPARKLLKRSLNTISVDNYWRNEARNVLRSFPDVLGDGCARLPAEGRTVPAAPPAVAASPPPGAAVSPAVRSVPAPKVGSSIPPAVLEVLPADAPSGHEAWVRAKFYDSASPLVKFNFKSESFYVAAKMAGGRHAAERLARALYVKLVQGASREEVLQSRKDTYEKIKVAMKKQR